MPYNAWRRDELDFHEHARRERQTGNHGEHPSGADQQLRRPRLPESRNEQEGDGAGRERYEAPDGGRAGESRHHRACERDNRERLLRSDRHFRNTILGLRGEPTHDALPAAAAAVAASWAAAIAAPMLETTPAAAIMTGL